MLIVCRKVGIFALVVAATSGSACFAEVRASLMGNRDVAPLGLEAAWSTVVRVDPTRSRVESMQVFPGLLLAQTSFGTVQAIDSETGRTMWAVSVGNPNYPTMSPGANAKYVAATNGSTLYLLDRSSGAILWEQKVGGSPCAGCAMNDERVYVPLESGLIEGYLLERRTGVGGLQDAIPKRFTSAGAPITAPVVFEKRINWTVAEGFVYSSEDAFKLTQFRFRTDDKISAAPAYMPPYVFAASRRGTVYGLDGVTGDEMWRISAENSISEPLIAVNGALYVVTETSDMLRINPAGGNQIWLARGIRQYVATSGSRVYVLDAHGRLQSRDAATGSPFGTAATYGFDLPCRNTVSDRIYLASTTGLVQCLREGRLTQPLKLTAGYAVQPPKKEGEAPAVEATPGETPAPAAAADDPFAVKP